MTIRRSAVRNAFMVTLLLVFSGCADPTVVRVYNGVPVEGRFIEYEAYAAYGRGLEAENDRHFDAAAHWFQQATEYDPKSVESWTHLGTAYCTILGREKAQEAFSTAERLDPKYEPLFRARAECDVSHAKLDEALADAARAVDLAPDQDEAVVLYARVLSFNKYYDKAARLLEGHLLRNPKSIPGWRARFELAQTQQDASSMKRSAEVLVRLAPRMSKELAPTVPALAPLARVDEAIRQGNIDEARKAARHAHLPPGELAVRAAAMGAVNLAREQAEHVLGADPSSSSARVALASASDVLADPARVGAALEIPMGERLTPLSPLARLVFAELLARRADRDAARLFVGTLDPDGTNDPVYEALRLHLVGRLGGTNGAKRGGT